MMLNHIYSQTFEWLELRGAVNHLTRMVRPFFRQMSLTKPRGKFRAVGKLFVAVGVGVAEHAGKPLKLLLSGGGAVSSKVLNVAPVVIGMALVGIFLMAGLPFVVIRMIDSSASARSAEVYFEEALRQKKMSDWQNAIGHFTSAIETDPDRYDAWAERGMGYLVIGEKDLAVADFRQSLQIEGGSGYYRGLSLRGLGELLDRPEHFAAAFLELEKATGEEPQNPDVWIEKGTLTRRMVELGIWRPETLLTAEADLAHAVNLAPEYYDAYLELAETRRLIGKRLEATVAK